MNYCQHCGKSHEQVDDCLLPSRIMREVQYRRNSSETWIFEVAPDESWLRIQIHGPGYSWNGRKWLLAKHMLKSEVIQTAFLAVLTAEEHEAREAFTYKGASVFSPHYNLDRLCDLIHQGGIEYRQNPMIQEGGRR